MEINSQKQLDAAAEFNNTIIARLANGKGVHAETAVSAAARMTGAYVLRASGLPLTKLKPGTSIFSDILDEKGQEALSLVDQALAQLGVAFDARKVDYDLTEEHNSHVDLKETQALLDEPFREIAENFGLGEEETAASLAAATALLIQQCTAVLDPHVAYAVVVYGMVEGCKTVPFKPGKTRQTVGAR